MGKLKKECPYEPITRIQSFTDRCQNKYFFVEKLEMVQKYIREKSEEWEVILYHGLAGIGKSFLEFYLEYELTHMESGEEDLIEDNLAARIRALDRIGCVEFDLEKVSPSRVEILLLMIERMVEKLKFSFPLTAAAFLRLETETKWKKESLGEKVAENKIIGVGASFIKCIPVVGTFAGLVQDINNTLAGKESKAELWK